MRKIDINNGLDNLFKKYESNGILESDCKTELELLFWRLLHERDKYGSNDFKYMSKKQQLNVIYKHYGININKHREFIKDNNGVIIRNLPANDKYKLVDAGSFSEGDYWCCENCGRIIKHWNEVQNESGVKFLVGSECISTVLKYDNTPDWDTSQKIAELNREKTFMYKVGKVLKTGGRIELSESGNHYYMYDLNNRYLGYFSVLLYNKYNRKGVKSLAKM